MAQQIQLRSDTQANWESVNPVLAEGEAGINLDLESGNMKIGDGVTAWNSLPYVTDRPYPEVGTVTLDEDNQILSVEDSVDSPTVDAVFGGASAEQIVVNGDFADGTTGWNTSGSVSVSQEEVVFGSNSLFLEWEEGVANISYLRNFNGKIALSCYVLIEELGGNNSFFMQFRKTGSAVYFENIGSTITEGDKGKWKRFTFVLDLSESGADELRIGNVSGSSIGKAYVDGVFVIPLTGTPYENFTADQMNAVVNEYWEGLKSTNKMSVLSRGRNLFDGENQSIVGASFISSKFNNTFTTSPVSAGNVFGFFQPGSPFVPVNPIRVTSLNKYVKVKIRRTSGSGNIAALRLRQYDINKQFISNVDVTAPLTITTKFNEFTALFQNLDSSTRYIIFAGLTATGASSAVFEFTDLIISDTNTTYEPYLGQQIDIECGNPELFALSQLPNGVQNEIKYGS
jgi:hypothetical protein